MYGHIVEASELESMPPDHARYLIDLCRRHAAHITALVAFECYADALRLAMIERCPSDSRACALEAISIGLLDPHDFLEQTPLMCALRERLR